MVAAAQPPLEAHDDGSYYERDVGPWVEDKHRLVFMYETLFSTGMKKKWDLRVYIDLYSGPGMLRVRDNGKFLWGSPLLALQVKHQFDKYIFCENNAEAMAALQKRVKKLFPEADVTFVPRDCNDAVNEICRAIPVPSSNNKVLSFCFVDPYDLSLKFSTIAKIASGYLIDFLALLALHMDGRRNQQHYLDTSNRKIDDFLDLPIWRDQWEQRSQNESISFPRFLAETYARQMETLGYLPVAFDDMKQVRSDVKNLPLYRLALFSRHQLAYTFWKDVLKYNTAQPSFW